MSTKALSWVWEHSRARGADLLVLLAIADYAHDDGTQATPSRKALAAKARISVRSVDRHVTHLCAIHELAVHRRHRPGDDSQWTSNEYVLVGLQRQSVATPQGQSDTTPCQSDARGSDSGDTRVATTVAHHKESEPSIEPTTGATTVRRRPVRKRDALMDALAVHAERQQHLAQVPRSLWSSIAAAKKELLEIAPDVTVTQVRVRAATMHDRYSNAGVHCLVKNWQRLGEPAASSDPRAPANMRKTTDTGG